MMERVKRRQWISGVVWCLILSQWLTVTKSIDMVQRKADSRARIQKHWKAGEVLVHIHFVGGQETYHEQGEHPRSSCPFGFTFSIFWNIDMEVCSLLRAIPIMCVKFCKARKEGGGKATVEKTDSFRSPLIKLHGWTIHCFHHDFYGNKTFWHKSITQVLWYTLLLFFVLLFVFFPPLADWKHGTKFGVYL